MARAFKILPKNYLDDWGAFESWSVGTVPDGWLINTAGTYSQETTNKKFGSYGLGVIGGSISGGVYRTVPNGSDFNGQTFKLGFWAKSASTGPYIRLSDGVTEKTCHLDGSNAFVQITTPSLKLDYNNTEIRIDVIVPEGVTAYFDSGVLCEGEDLWTELYGNIDVNDWNPSLNMKAEQYEISAREGSYIPEIHLESRPLRIRGTVVGTDTLSCRTHFDNLMRSLIAWQKDEQRSIYLYEDRVIDAFLKSFNWNYVASLRMIKYDLQFNIPKATTRYLGKLRHTEVIAGTGGEFNFSYNGNAESFPIVSFIADQGGAITTCSIENLTTKENFAYVGTVPTNVTLDINCLDATVSNSSVDKIGDFSGDFLRLVRGTNYFRFNGSPCTIRIDWFDRWY